MAKSITTQIWVNYIVENLYKFGNEFLEDAVSDDQYVLAGSIVHKPQAGAKPRAQKNRTQLPATITRRKDVDVFYPLDEYTTDPTLITDAETVELSYDKLASALRDHMLTLGELIAENGLFAWAAADATGGFAAASVIRTTGSAVAAHLQGATGNRKLFVEADLQKAKFTLDGQLVPMSGRCALIPSNLLDQLYNDLKTKYDYAYARDVMNGTIPALHGFKIIQRPSTLRYSNATTPVVKALEAANATTDNDSVICWQRDQVARARGAAKFFSDPDKPEYYGSVYSALVRFGAQKQREDSRGVLAVVQDASA